MTAISKITTLPQDLDELSRTARNEGFTFLDRLIQDFEKGANRFAGPSEALFEARQQSRLVAIGGLNIDPYATKASVGRIRRFYVSPDHRRSGVGRSLLEAIEQHAKFSFSELRLRTDTARGASFYDRMDYQRVANQKHATHIKTL